MRFGLLIRFLQNTIIAFFVTAILAIPIAWFFSNTFLYFVKSVEYKRVEFAPFEVVFVSEQGTTDRLGGDFALHPELFEKEGVIYSAEINSNTIQFITNKNGWIDGPCHATVNSQAIGCEQIAYFNDNFSIQKFVRLTGDIGITSSQSSQLNAPHYQFARKLESIRTISVILIPLSSFLCIRWFGQYVMRRQFPHFSPSRLQAIGLQLPWFTGLVFWTLLRVQIESWF